LRQGFHSALASGFLLSVGLMAQNISIHNGSGLSWSLSFTRFNKEAQMCIWSSHTDTVTKFIHSIQKVRTTLKNMKEV